MPSATTDTTDTAGDTTSGGTTREEHCSDL